MKDTMISIYEQFSKADRYIVGFVYRKSLYMTTCDHINPDLLTVEQASRNQGDNLRLRIRKAHKEMLVNESVCLGSADLLTADKYNKGELFEKAVTEYYGQVWVKDNIPFYVQGDIRINGVEIQIKLDGATLLNSKMMVKLVGAAA